MKEKLKYIVPTFWSVITIMFALLLTFNHTYGWQIELLSFLIVLTLGLSLISSQKGFVAERFLHPESKIKNIFFFPPITFFGAILS